MHKKIGIVIVMLLLLCIVAIPVYMRTSQINEQKSKEEIIEDNKISLIDLNENALSRIEIKDESTFIIEKQDKEWVDSEYQELVYDKESVNNMINALYLLESTQIIRNVQDENKYGINEKSRMITLYDDTNNYYTLRLGQLVSDKNILYIKTDLDKIIYVVNAKDAELLFQKRETMMQRQMTIPEESTITDIKISKKDQPLIHIQKNLVGKNEHYDTWTLEGFFKDAHSLDTEMINAMTHQMMTFEKSKFIGDKKEALEQYGLEDPHLIITLNNKWVIKFGKKEDGFIYFIYSNEPYVYTMEEDKLKAFNDIKPIAMIRKQVYMPDLSKLSQIKLSNPEQNLVIDIKKTAENSEAGLTSSIGEISFDETKTIELIQLIQDNICIEGELQNPGIEQKEERKAEISIVYNFEDHTTKTIELIPYDSNFYILRFEDTIEFAVGKEKIMSMFSMLHEMLKVKAE